MAAPQVQALLRFLSQDAKVPLATAMGKANNLIKADLTTYGCQKSEQNYLRYSLILLQTRKYIQGRAQDVTGDIQRRQARKASA